jgi:ATP-dependent Clp protease ATP-binding subunit ClpC
MHAGFSAEASQAIRLARDESERIRHYYVGVEHLFIGICAAAGESVRSVLRSRGVDPGVLIRLKSQMQPDECLPIWGTSLIQTPRLERVLAAAQGAARRRGEDAGLRDLLLAVIAEERSLPMRICRELGVDPAPLRRAIEELPVTDSTEAPVRPAAGMTPNLDRFGRDLTWLAANGRLDPLIGRESELHAMALVLRKKTQNNILIVGEAGTGKSHLVEGFAQRLADDSRGVFDGLNGKRIVEIDLNAMVAGTTYRGDFEARLDGVIREAMDPDIILFIDEFHLVMNAGSASGSAGASQVLKPYLARGEIRCIGATTQDEYARFVETDKALVRRFETITLCEPDAAGTLAILRGLSGAYRRHHAVEILDDALQASVDYSARYMPGRRFPEKAIELLDVACAQVSATGASPKRVGRAEIASIISQRTGVNPAVDGDVRNQLAGLRERLRERIAGQDDAIDVVVEAIRNARLGLVQPGRPLAVILLCGMSGVGKTEMARAMADLLFPGGDGLLRFEMSEFSEPISVSSLIGAPPAYAGHEEGGALTNAVRRNPCRVLLLDEIDKAHPTVWRLLLQVFEEGKLTDRNQRETDFSNTFIVMTSNLGAAEFAGRSRFGFGGMAGNDRYRELAAAARSAVERAFSAEFRNRIDEIVVFRPLDRSALRRIVDIELKKVLSRPGLAEHGITLSLADSVYEQVIAAGYHPEFGAREIKRAVSRLIVRGLGNFLAGGVPPGAAIIASAAARGIEFKIGGKRDAG